jgi:NADH-quinone oxidoreductase subunit N
VNPNLVNALTGFIPLLLPEMVLGVAACVAFLGGTWKSNRHLWGAFALLALAAASLAVWSRPLLHYDNSESAQAALFAGPVVFDQLTWILRVVSLAGGALLVLLSWDELPDDHAAEFHACLLLIVAGLGLTAAANDLVTLFLALELVSILTYVMLYLPRSDAAAQEAAVKYFLLSIFSSALLLFGFSYLYGLGGTTNLTVLGEALGGVNPALLPGVAVIALMMVVAGLGFRITAVPFHFYAPDVYQGTATANAALLAFVPKVAGFAALLRVLGFVTHATLPLESTGLLLGERNTVLLLWILAAVSMTLGNVLALLQDNLKRLLAYSSVAHAGYMLIGLAAAPKLLREPGVLPGGVEAVLFYLMAYGAMTLGAFAVLGTLSKASGQPVETVDDLAGLGRSHPKLALAMALFLFSLIGIPLTAGFMGKFWLIAGALNVPKNTAEPDSRAGLTRPGPAVYLPGLCGHDQRGDRRLVLPARHGGDVPAQPAGAAAATSAALANTDGGRRLRPADTGPRHPPVSGPARLARYGAAGDGGGFGNAGRARAGGREAVIPG